MTQTEVKASLIEQLVEKGQDTKYMLGLVDDYMQHYKIIRLLWKDVNKRGVKVDTFNSHGDPVVKDNESLASIQKEQMIMLKILQTLKLQEPVKIASNDDYL